MDSIRLELKPEFREPINAKGLGFFGRETELFRLTKLFQNRTSATVLVSGSRGAGKSSLVNEALKRVRSDGKNRVEVRLTLPHIYQKDADSDMLRSQILRGLARALYFAVKDKEDGSVAKDLKEQANSLYKKSYLKALDEKSVVGNLVTSEAEDRRFSKTETILKPEKILVTAFGTLLSGGLAIVGVSAIASLYSNLGWVWAIASALLITLTSFAAGITLTKNYGKESTFRDTATKEDRTTRTGQYDLTSETLEFDLHNLVRLFKDNKLPCVFIIDELDKLETEGVDEKSVIENHPIFKIVASLKNFFTLGSGIYVFITGDDFYLKLNDATRGGDYTLSHTLFTDKLFVANLHFSAIESLVDQLLNKKPDNEDLYHKFRNYLCWESRGHVFDLLKIIDEYVVFDEKNNPQIVAHEAGIIDGQWKEGNLPKDWKDAAGLQKYVGAIYDDSRRPSIREERYNHALWSSLLQVAYNLQNAEPVEIFIKQEGEDGGYKVPSRYWNKGLNDNDLTDISGAVERLLALLDRNGSVSTTEEPKTVKILEADVQKQVKSYTLYEKIEYPDSSISKAEVLTDYEKYFVELTDSVTNILKNAKGAGVAVEEFSTRLTKAQELTVSVRTTSLRRSTPKSEITLALEDVDKIGEELAVFAINGVITSWAQTKGAQVVSSVDETETRTAQSWGTSLSVEFSDLVEELRKTTLKYFLIGGSTEDQMLVINNWPGEDLQKIASAYSSALKNERGREKRRWRLPIIAITPSSEGKAAAIPKELVVELENAERLSISKSRSKHQKNRISEKRNVVGWHSFVLQHELSNLDKLAPILEEASNIKVA